MAANRLRLSYFDGMELDSRDFECEQRYLDGLRREFCIGLHTWGVAFGLDVSLASDGRSLTVAPGMAISQAGGEIVLPEPMLVPGPSVGAGLVDLFIGAEDAPAERDESSLELGYKRRSSVAVAHLIQRGKSVPVDVVLLTTLDVNANGVIVGSDPTARRYCGLDAGRVAFLAAPKGSAAATIGVAASGGLPALAIDSDGTEIFGLADVAGGVTVVPGGSAPPARRFATLDLTGDQALLSVQDTNGDGIFEVDDQGRSFVGGKPKKAPEGRLTVNGGIALDAGRRVLFAEKGKIAWNRAEAAGGAVEVGLDDATVSIQNLADGGGIAMSTGHGKAEKPNAWVMAPDGHVGIGTGAPAYALTVDGFVQSTHGGYEFPDGKTQPTAANSTSVMVGAIIDWWRPAGSKLSYSDHFQLCDNSLITDKDSPLNGQYTPDLTGLYTIGAEDFGNIGHPELQDWHIHEIDEMPKHDHPIRHTHSVAGWVDSQDDGDSDDSDSHCTSRGHRHYIQEEIGATTTQDSSANSELAHPLPTGHGVTTPPSMQLFKLMRIK